VTASTLVATPSGPQPIAQVEVGDEVMATDELSGTTAAYPVTAVWSHGDRVTGTVVINGESISVTPDHPFMTVGRGWQQAANLQVGDHIVSVRGEPGLVTTITWDAGPDTMWNIAAGSICSVGCSSASAVGASAATARSPTAATGSCILSPASTGEQSDAGG